MKGVKHMVECHCILPQFKYRESALYHKFIVFSIIDDSDTVIPKFAQCNNCGVVHRIFDICKSEIVAGKEDLNSITTKEEMSLSLSSDLVDVLKTYNVDLPTWEQASFIITHKKWGENIILSKDFINDEVTGKRLVFVGPQKFKLEEFLASNMMNTNEP